MKVCFDVDYQEDYAVVAALLFEEWGDEEEVEIIS